MIKTFSCKKTQKLFETGRATGFLTAIEVQAKRKLAMLHLAIAIEDLRVPPGNRLEVLKGERKGQFSIRINDQYRLCFRFEDGNAEDVEIVDYHR
ncbi:MAG: type II toxin-antitoxin system RelE/ParE family toxin [Deltaproteobacteria bacterium]|nr:type II toxin-antitoxin system RelE/ParE family toxin [Deltaproteobacteria bacterium]